MAFPGTMSFKSKYHHTDRDVPTHVFIIYCNFAMWFINVSSNALPVHVFFFFCEEMSTEGAVYKGHVICNDMYVFFSTRNGRFLHTRHDVISEQFKTVIC